MPAVNIDRQQDAEEYEISGSVALFVQGRGANIYTIQSPHDEKVIQYFSYCMSIKTLDEIISYCNARKRD